MVCVEKGGEFKLYSSVPESLDLEEVNKAVKLFVEESGCKDDKVGLYDQTLDTIANRLIYKPKDQFVWALIERGKLYAYALSHITREVDNNLSYCITQAWLHRSYRGSRFTKIFFGQLREHAKSVGCKHIIIPSTRAIKPYLRWLGEGWHVYCTLLKEDI